MFGTLLCAAPALQLKAWESLQTKTAAAAAGYTLRDGLVPSSAPQATIPLVPHGDVDPANPPPALGEESDDDYADETDDDYGDYDDDYDDEYLFSDDDDLEG